MEVTTEVYCKFDGAKLKERFCSILNNFPTPPNGSSYDKSKLIELFAMLGSDISDVKYHVDPEWSIYNISVQSDTEVSFFFEENNDFSWDDMPAFLRYFGCIEVFTKTLTDNGDVFMGLDEKGASTLLYTTGNCPEIDEPFLDDGCFEGGNVHDYIKLYRNNDFPKPPPPNKARQSDKNFFASLRNFFRS
ncbi:hypothetical protein ACJJIR_15015 [Microbulbifer sp. SSSA008]|uniref:hypothetical protein n=1 Tax=Microbulbifer sp. SSSA008 TaxID=3243380 RepID=UPI004039FCA3